MKKFDQRNILKKSVDLLTDELYVKAREIRFGHVGVNVGNEQDGKGTTFQRPMLIIKKVGNMFFAVPMTTKGKDNKFHYTLSDNYFGQQSRVILSQARMIDKKRLTDKIGIISQEDFLHIKEKLKELLL